MGEGEGGGGQDKDPLGPPLPFIPSHRGEGRLSGEHVYPQFEAPRPQAGASRKGNFLSSCAT